MKRTVTALSLLTLVAYGLTAAELTNINIGGQLKKTKDQTVLTIIGYEEGDEIESSAKDEIHQKLLKSGLFISEEILIDLRISGDQAELDLFLKEKITTVPIPLVAVSEDKLQAGLFIINSNLGGTGDQLFFGFLAGEDSQYGTINFTNRNFLSSSWDLGGRTVILNSETIISDSQSSEITSYSSLMAKGGLFGQWNYDIWSFGSGMDAGFLRVDKMADTAKTTVFTLSPEISAEVSTLRYQEFFPEGVTGKTEVRMDIFGETFDNSVTGSLEGGWRKNLHPRLQMAATAGMTKYAGDELFSFPVLSPIIPDTVHAETLVQGSLSLTAAVLDFSWGYLALPLNYHIGVFDGISGETELFHGPSTGLSLNLKKIALPAVSFIYGWNMETSEGRFQFNLGFH